MFVLLFDVRETTEFKVPLSAEYHIFAVTLLWPLTTTRKTGGFFSFKKESGIATLKILHFELFEVSDNL